MADQLLCMANGPWEGNCGLPQDCWVHGRLIDRIDDAQGLIHDFVAPPPTVE